MLKIDTFRTSSSFYHWLYAILVNLIHSDMRRKAANALDFVDEVPESVDPRPNPADTLAVQEESAAVQASLDILPPVMREVVVFRYWEDLTVPEIAAILAIPEGTVKSQLFQAKNLIRVNISRTIGWQPASSPTSLIIGLSCVFCSVGMFSVRYAFFETHVAHVRRERGARERSVVTLDMRVR